MSKKQCQATKQSGEPCHAAAGEAGFCFTHDATKGKERALARRNGGLKRITPHVANAALVPKETRTIEGVMMILDYALQESVALSNGVSVSGLRNSPYTPPIKMESMKFFVTFVSLLTCG